MNAKTVEKLFFGFQQSKFRLKRQYRFLQLLYHYQPGAECVLRHLVVARHFSWQDHVSHCRAQVQIASPMVLKMILRGGNFAAIDQNIAWIVQMNHLRKTLKRKWSGSSQRTSHCCWDYSYDNHSKKHSTIDKIQITSLKSDYQRKQAFAHGYSQRHKKEWAHLDN